MAFPAFLDTCTLFGGAMNDLILDIAERGAFRALWSEGVLEELQRALTRRGISPESAAHRVNCMRTAFPDANTAGYEHLIEDMKNDPGDRHVLAAAVRAGAEVIVTFNLKHFPQSALAPYQVIAVHPDDFLLDQLDLYRDLTLGAVEETAGK